MTMSAKSKSKPKRKNDTGLTGETAKRMKKAGRPVTKPDQFNARLYRAWQKSYGNRHRRVDP